MTKSFYDTAVIILAGTSYVGIITVLFSVGWQILNLRLPRHLATAVHVIAMSSITAVPGYGITEYCIRKGRFLRSAFVKLVYSNNILYVILQL